jgi:uncharacterized membrane protein
MRAVSTLATILALAAFTGCQSTGSEGGSAGKDEGFKIAVPSMESDIKQGDTQSVMLSLQRGDFFKQDVKLDIRTTAGLTVDPTSVTVKASDRPDVQVRVSAAKDAPLVDCHIYVTATPATGEPSTATFDMKVIAPQ